MISPEKVDLIFRISQIAVPAFVALVVPILATCWLARRLARYQKDLNKELEDHKKGISKELEHHKQQLQSDFQRKLYEFQTRYSLLHQKRAAVIETLFGLLVKVQNDLQVWAGWELLSGIGTKEELFAKTNEDFQNLINFYDEKRIYLDEEIGNGVLAIVRTTRMLLDSQQAINHAQALIPQMAESMKAQAAAIIDQNIHPVIRQLENKFKSLLSAEPAIPEIDRRPFDTQK